MLYILINKGRNMESLLKDNERVDDLEFKGLKIIQNPDGFCFGIDSVLVSDFAKDIKKNSKVIDLGTGTGIIATLLCGKTELSKIVGVEVQEEVCDMARRSIQLNKLENKFEVINENITNLKNIYKRGDFDVVVTNPPYKKVDTGIKNEKEKKLISRHEVKASLEEFIKISNYLLKDKGDFYMVHRPDRLVDILTTMRQNKIEPKILRFVAPNKNKVPNLILIKGVKNGRPFLKMQEVLYIYDEQGNYTDEIMRIYNK